MCTSSQTLLTKVRTFQKLCKKGKIQYENISVCEEVLEKYEQSTNFIPSKKDQDNKIEYFMKIFNVREGVKKHGINIYNFIRKGIKFWKFLKYSKGQIKTQQRSKEQIKEQDDELFDKFLYRNVSSQKLIKSQQNSMQNMTIPSLTRIDSKDGKETNVYDRLLGKKEVPVDDEVLQIEKNTKQIKQQQETRIKQSENQLQDESQDKMDKDENDFIARQRRKIDERIQQIEKTRSKKVQKKDCIFTYMKSIEVKKQMEEEKYRQFKMGQ